MDLNLSLKDYIDKEVTITKYLVDNPIDRDELITLGALCSILNRYPDFQRLDYSPQSKADELMNDRRTAFTRYMESKSNYQESQDEEFKKKMLMDLDSMLIIDHEIMLMIYNSADCPEEKQKIKDACIKLTN